MLNCKPPNVLIEDQPKKRNGKEIIEIDEALSNVINYQKLVRKIIYSLCCTLSQLIHAFSM